MVVGCHALTVDNLSMRCYLHRSDMRRIVNRFKRMVAPFVGRSLLSTPPCFGSLKGRAVGKRAPVPMPLNLPTLAAGAQIVRHEPGVSA